MSSEAVINTCQYSNFLLLQLNSILDKVNQSDVPSGQRFVHILDNLSSILSVRNLLADEESKTTYDKFITLSLSTGFLSMEKAIAAFRLIDEAEWAQYEKKAISIKDYVDGGYLLDKIEAWVLEGYSYKNLCRVEVGDVVIDGGAHTGNTAFYFASLVGENGSVYSFEPGVETHKTLQKNVKGSSHKNIFVFDYALGDMDKTASFTGLNRPGDRLTENGSYNVKVTSIDNFVHLQGIDKINFIKLDIELSELDALSGSVKTIQNHHPKMAICIYHKPDDHFLIPERILSIHSGYKFYIKQNSYDFCKTVLFCLPTDEKQNFLRYNDIFLQNVVLSYKLAHRCLGVLLPRINRYPLTGFKIPPPQDLPFTKEVIEKSSPEVVQNVLQFLQADEMKGIAQDHPTLISFLLTNLKKLVEDYMKEKKWGKARDTCLLGLELNATDTIFQFYLGKMTMNLGDLAQAERIFLKLLGAAPKREAYIVSLADVWVQGKCLVQAEAILKQTLVEQPEYKSLWLQLGRLFIQKEEWLDARSCFETVIALDPNHFMAHLQLASVLSHLNDWEYAHKHYHLAFSLSQPSKIWIRIYLQDCLKHDDHISFDAFNGNFEVKNIILNTFHNKDILKQLYGDIVDDSVQYNNSLMTAVNSVQPVFKNCSIFNEDHATQLVNIQDGYRVTLNQPSNADYRISLFGQSQLLGNCCEDRYTIASFLQHLSNTKTLNAKVLNAGLRGVGFPSCVFRQLRASTEKNDVLIYFHGAHPSSLTHDVYRQKFLKYIEAIYALCPENKFYLFFSPHIWDITDPSMRESVLQRDYNFSQDNVPSPSDIAMGRTAMYASLREKGIPFYDLSHLVQRPHDLGEIFFDATHFIHRLNQRIAEEIFTVISQDSYAHPQLNVDLEDLKQWAENNAAKDMAAIAKRNYSINLDIQRWIYDTKEGRFAELKNIGAIVMNANPFTLGHLHLVEYALTQVDGLYVFVVEEDKSEFSFADRLFLINKNLAHLHHKIAVRPSGKFIISSLSFPDYFTKTCAVDTGDSTLDVLLFGAILAPALDITHRFVGEEPHDIVTNAYNETMKFFLPPLGITVSEIPRAGGASGEVISASTVRKALALGDYERLKTLVPPATYDYLLADAKNENVHPMQIA